jgi:hypothetical protein
MGACPGMIMGLLPDMFSYVLSEEGRRILLAVRAVC